MKIDVLTLFPGMFGGPLDESIVQRARKKGVLDLRVHNLREWTHDRHRTVDDRPFGGGPGMVLKCEPIFEAIDSLRGPGTRVVLMCPTGRPFEQAVARELSGSDHLVMICPSYEGVDERVLEHAVDLEVSIGDFVVSGGELPAMVVIDAVSRRIAGVLGGEGSLDEESFDEGLLEYPQYTRPAEFRGWSVPEVLLSGNHAEIGKWRRRLRLLRTRLRRPDLLRGASLTAKEQAWLHAQPLESGPALDGTDGGRVD